MALKIRLRQQGKKNYTVYRLVLTDSHSPRDGKYLEMLGWYNPYAVDLEKAVSVDSDRIQFWLDKGAELTESAKTLLRRGSPQLMENYRNKVVAAQVKEREKRKEIRRRKKAGAAGKVAAPKTGAEKKSASKAGADKASAPKAKKAAVSKKSAK